MTRRSPPALGPTLHDGGAIVAVDAPAAESVVLVTFDAADRETGRHLLAERSGGLHLGEVPGLAPGVRYGLRADGPRHDPAKLLVDPAARRLDRPFRLHPDLAAPRSAGRDTAALVPKAIVEADAAPTPRGPVIEPSRRVVFEVGVKALTRLDAAVPEALRGRVAALAHPAVVERFLRLGVTTIELMPLAAWIDERHLPPLGLANAWGYNPVVFAAPDPRLAPDGPAEVRAALAALHAAGLEVILDVVVNHTGESDRLGPTLSLRGLDEATYHREIDGVLVNDTGCGHTLASDHPSVVRLVMQALRTWAALGFDGFRFDLATVLGRSATGFSPDAPLLTALRQDPLLADRLLVAEPWDVGPGGYRLGGFPAPFLEWNDRFRDDVRRFWRGDGGRAALATRLAGSADLFGPTRGPLASVNFVAAHDGFTLADTVAYATKHNEANGEANRDGDAHAVSWNNGVEGPTDDPAIRAARARDVAALLATLFLARGTPMLTAGDEAGRTQHGNNNAYAQDNAVTWLDPATADAGRAAFVAALARLRAAHPALRGTSLLDGTGDPPDVTWLDETGAALVGDAWHRGRAGVLGAVLHDAASGDRVAAFFVAEGSPAEVALPAPRPGHDWRLRLDSSRERADLDEPIGPTPTLPPRAVVALVEVARPGRPRLAAPDDLVGRLARAAGVAPSWWSIDGRQTRVPVETERALLAAMGFSTATIGDVEAGLVDLARRRHGRLLPEIAVGRGRPVAVDLALPPGETFRARDLRLEIDHGEASDVAVKPWLLDEVGRRRVDGVELSVRRLPLPDFGVGRARLVDVATGRAAELIAAPRAASTVPSRRITGLSAQLYAARTANDLGIGDVATLRRLVALAARRGDGLLGLNPLHALFATDPERASPYHPSDREALDPLTIDVAAAARDLGLPAVLARIDGEAERIARLRAAPFVARAEVAALKSALIGDLFAGFASLGEAHPRAADFTRFRAERGSALAGFCRFEALARHAGTVDRSRWEASVRTLSAAPLPPAIEALATRVAFEQWCVARQFAAVAADARAEGVGLYRDLAVGPAPDGAEVWRQPGAFLAGVSVGAPPDPFSASGQVWNLPPPDPLHLVADGARGFGRLIAANLEGAAALRIDHAMGLTRLFLVPDGARGSEGAYVAMPEDALFATLAVENARAGAILVGEDLGTVPEGFAARLAAEGLLGTRVALFERDGDGFRPPETWPEAAVACVSTHDLVPFAGWRAARDVAIDLALGRVDAAEAERRRATRAAEVARFHEAAGVGPEADARRATTAFLARLASRVVLDQAEDVAGATEPVNVPGTDREYPNWRRRFDVPEDDT